jgi:hypothetical protein
MRAGRVLLLLWAYLPIAAYAWGSSGTGPISQFNVDPPDQLIAVNGSWANPDSCGTSGFGVIQMTNANYKDLLAAIMMASASAKNVNLWFNGCVATPWGNAPLVTIVTVY